MTFQWYGDAALAHVEARAWEGIARATVYAWQKVQQAVNVPNTGERRKRRRDTAGGPRGSQYTVYPHPAPRGQPPHKRTGWLAGHVTYRLDRATLTGRLGIFGMDAQHAYPAFLELGGWPWLLSTVEAHLPQLTALAGGREL